ncbi:hypothetical protein EB796_007355 [Bugula neritina]|uniref:Uncharacterized protein n=1 Tax=Bugula neritina TaxID=10212 RepID=A0A7J7K6U1_BUGNE|nr:hypothetical protein EB796_007355 [Bugula neritina]
MKNFSKIFIGSYCLIIFLVNWSFCAGYYSFLSLLYAPSLVHPHSTKVAKYRLCLNLVTCCQDPQHYR